MQRSRAFTLVELLVVVAIISLLLSILLPAFEKARSQARAVLCMGNTRQIAMGVITYTIENSDYVPYTAGTPDRIPPGEDPNVFWDDRISEKAGILPPPDSFAGSLWNCPFWNEMPNPRWMKPGGWYTHYAMNLYLTAYPRVTDGTWWWAHKLAEAPGSDTILIGDGALVFQAGLGNYFGTTIDENIQPDPGVQYKSPWPVDPYNGDVVNHHGGVSIGGVDGHGEQYRGLWGHEKIYSRFRRSNMTP